MSRGARAENVILLAEDRFFAASRDVPLGPWLAPVAVAAQDAQGVGRDVLIAVQLHDWSPPVVQRMASVCEAERDRLRHLTEADFVALVVPGDDPAAGAMTSVGELGGFLDGFAPPVGRRPVCPRSKGIFQAPPEPT